MAGLWSRLYPTKFGRENEDKPWYNDAAEVGRQVGAGFAVDLPRALGQGLRYVSRDGGALDDLGRSIVEDADRRSVEWEPNLEGRGLVAEALIKGGRAVGPMAPAIAASMNPFGAITGPAVAAATFGTSTAQDTEDKLRLQGVPDEDAAAAARRVGLVQGPAEGVATALGIRAFRPFVGALSARAGMGGVVGRMTDTSVIKPLAKGLSINLLVQPSTEVAQDVGTEFIERAYGAEPEDAGQIARDSALAGAGLTALLGPFATGAHIRRARGAAMLKDALFNPNADPSVKALARDIVVERAKQENIPFEQFDSWLDSQFEADDALNQPSETPPSADPLNPAAGLNDPVARGVAASSAAQRTALRQRYVDLLNLPTGVDRESAALGGTALGAGLKPSDYSARQAEYDRMFSEPSGVRVPDPTTGLERELTTGDQYDLQSGTVLQQQPPGQLPLVGFGESGDFGIAGPPEDVTQRRRRSDFPDTQTPNLFTSAAPLTNVRTDFDLGTGRTGFTADNLRQALVNEIDPEAPSAAKRNATNYATKIAGAFSAAAEDPKTTAQIYAREQAALEKSSAANPALTQAKKAILDRARTATAEFHSALLDAYALEGQAKARPGARVGARPESQGTEQQTRERNQRAKLDEDIAATDARVAEFGEARRMDERARVRARLLDEVLRDPRTVNPLGRFEARLKRYGFADRVPTAQESESISRWHAARDTFDAQQGQIPESRESLDAKNVKSPDVGPPVPEKEGKGPGQPTRQLSLFAKERKAREAKQEAQAPEAKQEAPAEPVPAVAPAEPEPIVRRRIDRRDPKVVWQYIREAFEGSNKFPNVSWALGSDWGYGYNFGGKPDYYKKTVFDLVEDMYGPDPSAAKQEAPAPVDRLVAVEAAARDRLRAARERKVSLLRADGRKPYDGTKKRAEYDAAERAEEEAMELWTAADNQLRASTAQANERARVDAAAEAEQQAKKEAPAKVEQESADDLLADLESRQQTTKASSKAKGPELVALEKAIEQYERARTKAVVQDALGTINQIATTGSTPEIRAAAKAAFDNVDRISKEEFLSNTPAKFSKGETRKYFNGDYVFHAVANDADLDSIVENGLRPGSNVSFDEQGQAFSGEGETILVFRKSDVSPRNKGYQNDGVTTSTASPVAIFKDTSIDVKESRDSALEKLGDEYAELDKTLDSFAQTVGMEREEFDSKRNRLSRRKAAFVDAFGDEFGERIFQLHKQEERLFNELDRAEKLPDSAVSEQDVLDRYAKHGLPVHSVDLSFDEDTNETSVAVRSSGNATANGPSKQALEKTVEEQLSKLGHKPKVVVLDSPNDMPALAAHGVPGNPAGVLFEGTIYLFRNGITDMAAGVRTLWHELVHYGMRRFMTKEQYVSRMNELYQSDLFIKQEADKWINSGDPDVEAARRIGGEPYVRARGVDEALAELAERNKGEFKDNSLLEKSRRTVQRWLAKIAQAFGFHQIAAELRAMNNDEARQHIRDLFDKLYHDAPAVSTDPDFTAEAAFSKEKTPSTSRREFIRLGAGLAVWAGIGPQSAFAEPKPELAKLIRSGNAPAALDWIAKNSDSPEYRKLAAQLSKLLPSSVKTIAVKLEPTGDGIKLVGNSPETELAALRNPKAMQQLRRAMGVVFVDRDKGGATIWLRDSSKDSGISEETFLHEVVHAAIIARYDMLNYYLANPGKFGTNNADEALKTFRKVYSEFRQVAEKEARAPRAEVWITEPYSSPDEFLSYALTSPDFQEWLKARQYQGTSLWERFKQAVTRILGIPTGKVDVSWLDAALMISNDVLSEAAKDAPNFNVSRQIGAAFGKRASLEDTLAHSDVAEAKAFGLPDPKNYSRMQSAVNTIVAGLTNWRDSPWTLGWFSMRQLKQRFGSGDTNNPNLVDKFVDAYLRMGQRADEIMREVFETTRHWQSLPKDDQLRLGRVALLSTIEQIHPHVSFWHELNNHIDRTDPQEQARYNRVRTAFDAAVRANPRVKDVYLEALKTSRELWDMLATARAKDVAQAHEADLAGRFTPAQLLEIVKSPAKRKEVRDGILDMNLSLADRRSLRSMMDSADEIMHQKEALKGPYFPLRRFGNHVVVAKSNTFKSEQEAFEVARDKLQKLYEKDPPENEAEEAEYEAELKEARREVNDARAKVEGLKSAEQHYVVSFFERDWEAQAYANDLKNDPDTARHNLQVTVEQRPQYERQFDGASPQFIRKMEEQLKSRMPKASFRDVQDAVRDIYLRSSPDKSALKSELKRLNVPGARATEMLRGFAQYGMGTAFRVSRMEHGRALNDSLADLRGSRERDDVLLGNELGLRLAQAFSPPRQNKVINGLSQMTHLSYLGLSPSYVMVNATQPWVITLPIMSARHGWMRAASALGSASAEVAQVISVQRKAEFEKVRNEGTAGAVGGFFKSWRFNLKPEQLGKNDAERAMLKNLFDVMLLDITMEHDVAATSSGTSETWLGKASDMAAVPAHIIEIVNRAATALAAFRLEQQRGRSYSDARDYAINVVADTHFDYSGENSPRHMRADSLGGFGRLVWQFKKYQQGMFFLMGKLLRDASKGDTEAMKAAGYLTGTIVGVAGTSGFFFAADLALLMKALAQLWDDDDEPDIPQWLYNGLKDMVGEDLARLIWKGGPAMLGADFSKKLAAPSIAGNLRLDSLSGKNARDLWSGVLVGLTGPATGMMLNWADAADVAFRDPLKAFQLVLPKFLADPLRVVERSERGIRTRYGSQLIGADEFGGWELGFKALGIESTRVSDMYEQRGALNEARSRLADKRGELIRDYVQGRLDGEPTGEVMDEIAAFNRRNPANRIKMETLQESLKNRRKANRETVDGIRANKKDADLLNQLGR